ncbi:MAG: heavy metal-binding domain-containing protein [Bacillota bacterium]
MLLRIIVASVVVALVGMYVVRAAAVDQQAPKGGCCGMRAMAPEDAAKTASHDTAASAKDAGCGGCAMMGKDAESGSALLAAKATTRPTTAPSSAVNASSTVYTCPMHPEVIANKPGKCPKCGMDLVAKQEKPKGDQKPADKGDAGDGSTSHMHNH